MCNHHVPPGFESAVILASLQIFLEITEMNKRVSGSHSFDVQKMQFLLATVFESARLLPSGPLLQRCSLKYGENFS